MSTSRHSFGVDKKTIGWLSTSRLSLILWRARHWVVAGACFFHRARTRRVCATGSKSTLSANPGVRNQKWNFWSPQLRIGLSWIYLLKCKWMSSLILWNICSAIVMGFPCRVILWQEPRHFYLEMAHFFKNSFFR